MEDYFGNKLIRRGLTDYWPLSGIGRAHINEARLNALYKAVTVVKPSSEQRKNVTVEA